MTDDEQEESPKRPNPNYALSKTKDQNIYGEEGITYHYNRERRLENAPAHVKDLYTENKPVKFGVFKSLVSNKPTGILFFTIIIIVAVIFILSMLGRLDNFYTLEGNRLDISAILFEDNTLIVMKKTVNKSNKSFHTGAVDIAVSCPGDDIIYFHHVFFTMNSEEIFRFAVPFYSPQLLMVVQTERNTLKLQLTAE